MREKLLKMFDKILWLCLFINLWTCICAFDAKTFDDTVLFKLNWPGKDFESLASDEDYETLVVTTTNNEKYKCLLPQNLEKEKEQSDMYTGPNAVELLSPLFTQSSCSYRLESYWTYELCHGRYIRQYHEERDGKKHKLQEYYLGKWDAEQLADFKELLDRQDKSTAKTPLPVKKIDGLSLPYLQINMSDGTKCDLNGNSRMTKVQYVCYIHGKHEVYSLKESSTCEYEAVVLSPFLCQHPDYRAQETGEHPISCLPVEGAAKKPKDLLAMEAESLKLRHQRQSDDDDMEVNAEYFWQDETLKKMYAVFSIDGEQQDGEARVRVEIHPVDLLADTDITAGKIPTPGSPSVDPTGPPMTSAQPTAASGASPVTNFLNGKNCLTGGSGWWKYEFCYGRTVTQYHEDKTGARTSIELGRFNLSKHRAWLEQNPHKKVKPLGERKQVSHFYSDGSYCEKADKPRQVEVKLKCLEDSSPGAVALYLLEPRVCEYLLGVESPAVCDILSKVDEDGLLPDIDDTPVKDPNVVETIQIVTAESIDMDTKDEVVAQTDEEAEDEEEVAAEVQAAEQLEQLPEHEHQEL